jgi:hypothetical protein
MAPQGNGSAEGPYQGTRWPEPSPAAGGGWWSRLWGEPELEPWRWRAVRWRWLLLLLCVSVCFFLEPWALPTFPTFGY